MDLSCNDTSLVHLEIQFVYKFDNKPIRVRIMVKNLNEQLSDTSKLVDLNWESFIYLLNEKYQIDLEGHK